MISRLFTKKQRRLIYNDAFKTFGPPQQMGMVYEELAELIAAANQWNRRRIEKERLAEEIADARIMIEQLQFITGIDDEMVSRNVDRKLKRLKERISKCN